MPYPSRGTGGGGGALIVATRSDNNNPAVFADIAARDTYTATPEGTADAARINVSDASQAREVFAVGTLDGSNQVTGITAAFARVNGAWVSVATNLVGTPGQDGAPGMGLPLASDVVTNDLLVYSTDNGGELQRAPARMESSDLVITAAETELEADAFSMTPGTSMGFSSSFQFYQIDQFPGLQFTPPDAANRRDGPSFEMRYFHLTEAENDLPSQPITTEALTSPISFDYTATINSRINALKFTVGTPVTNLRAFIRYQGGENAPIRYWPTREAWLTQVGGQDFAAGEMEIDLEGSELRLFFDQPGGPNVVNVEIRYDSGTLLGDTNDVPQFTPVVQRGEFRNLVFEQQLTPRIRSFDISSVADKTPLAPFTLSGSQTFTFQVDNPQTARDITIRQGATTIATLTTDQLASGSIAATVTSQTLTNPGNEIIFTLRMEDVNGILITDTVRIRVPEEHELAYYDVRAANDFTTADVSGMTSVDVTASGTSFVIDESWPNTEWLGILVPSNRDIVSIQSAFGNVLSGFTRTANARTIGTQTYILYVEQNNAQDQDTTAQFTVTTQ